MIIGLLTSFISVVVVTPQNLCFLVAEQIDLIFDCWKEFSFL